MTQLAWVTLYILASALGSLAYPLLSRRFPLNLAPGKPGDTRSTLFMRLVLALGLFAGISGVIGGAIAMAAALLSR
jgi:hypothetical protein